MNEIHTKKNEQETEGRLRLIPEGGAISLDGVSFHYDIPDAPDVLRGVSFDIEPGTVTAIVGNSGSGKSSLLNLMLGLYEPTEGEIRIGNTSLATIDRNYWRQQVGVVMQDGYVFSDTLARNIALGSNIVDQERLLEAAKVAQIERFVDKLPAGYNTLIGENGLGLSMGQKQRLLIARAIYSRPRYLFLDEATAGLTAFTELTIVDELLARLRGTTIVMVAHRYSTIEQADQVVVMSEGRVVEIGHHKELYGKRNAYFRLVRNQTLLGN